jgi:hypothetical protein
MKQRKTGQAGGVWSGQAFRQSLPMPPDRIDFSLIDSSVRALVRRLNETSWCRTFGSCGGKADHGPKGPDFYLLLEVRGSNGMWLLREWLSHSHAEGWKAAYITTMTGHYACVRAELHHANFIHGEVNDPDWVRLQLGFVSLEPLTVAKTDGGIRALGMGLDKLVTLHPEAGPVGSSGRKSTARKGDVI